MGYRKKTKEENSKKTKTKTKRFALAARQKIVGYYQTGYFTAQVLCKKYGISVELLLKWLRNPIWCFIVLLDMLEKKLENKNIKPTTMRLLVLRQLVGSGTAISLGDLEAKFERADKATLYRTLKTFEDKNLIHSIDDGTGSVKYALCEEGCECEPQDQHIHFHCVKCGKTYCLTQSKIPQTQIPSGFKASSASMVYKGVCANCP